MRIHFNLYKYYVVFFDLRAIFNRLGQLLYKEEMYLIYDGSCNLAAELSPP